jgi:hypothetical protein
VEVVEVVLAITVIGVVAAQGICNCKYEKKADRGSK